MGPRKDRPTYIQAFDGENRASFTVFGVSAERCVRLLVKALHALGFGTRRNRKRGSK